MVHWYLNTHIQYYLNSLVVISLIFTSQKNPNALIPFWVIYALLPLMDLLIPDDNMNPTAEESKILAKQFKWKIPLYLFIFVEWYLFFYVLAMITNFDVPYSLIFINSVTSGHGNAIQFLFAHELFHKKNTFDRTLGTVSMIKNLYMHFYLEHIYGHHKYVSTPQDPATAKLNQTLYSFIIQTIRGSFLNSWNREVKWLKSHQKSVFSLSNRMLLYLFLEILFTVVVFLIWGFKGLFSFIVRALVSIFILETINYIRHYGLLRKEISPGIYEPVTIKHSWNAPQWTQNALLLKLQRHSDHHENSYKPYQCLLSLKESPNLPAGYLVCIPAAICSPVWFHMINPLAIEINQRGIASEKAQKQAKKIYYCWITLQIAFFTALLRFG